MMSRTRPDSRVLSEHQQCDVHEYRGSIAGLYLLDECMVS